MRYNKWQPSLVRIDHGFQKSKLQWQQFSADKLTVLQHMKILSFTELQEKYSNLSEFFWRDKGESFSFHIPYYYFSIAD